MTALLELPEPPTAVFAASDLMAAGAIGVVSRRAAGADDVAVVGFDRHLLGGAHRAAA